MLPPLLSGRARRDRTRRALSVATVALSVVSLLSVLYPPLRERFEPILHVLPLGVPITARTLLVFVSVALLLLARGLRTGQRLAWVTALALLVVTSVLHLLKGIDVEEAVLALALAGWMATQSAAFPVRPALAQVRRAGIVVAVGAVVTTAVSVVLVVAVGAERHPGETVVAVVERLVGYDVRPFPKLHGHPDGLVNPLLQPALLAFGVCLVALGFWALFGPRTSRRSSPEEHVAERERARAVVAEFGGDTLDYFALRDDKDWFFAHGGVVAFSVRNGVCLVSPDPICSPAARGDLLTEFCDHVERHGWSLAVVGARADWLPFYEAAGLRPVYLGDEAVLDCTTFSLTGKSMKSLRGAVNRITKAGVVAEFRDPATLTPAEQAELLAISGESRHGDAERGFSMTLSRIFDPADTGLLLTVARFADGRPAGFIQWIPAADVDGFSLDVMRRSTADDVPNGLTDFLIVATAQHLAAQGMRGLGLNFAVMRQVVAGEREGTVADIGRRILKSLSNSAQIESLWKFNAKYDPEWRARYVILDTLEFAAAQGLTIADAEGVAELPVVGRFLGRSNAAS
ncbi:bifunctional lysylphosphatidylglycerol flippase/synthetase MprF [Kineococcus gynurae]|uniref:Bifunctional lysylphosphatidylglycerol flippase/synthetase MprF n=1 Tax=Kineococcus gynurae TaxID=452979 RepID=A0ABV5LTJ6_9ACTN